MAMGEIFLGSLFEVLLDKLASMGLEYVQREGINITLLQCKGMLETIKAALDDTEDRELNGERLVKLWLDDVRDLAYDMEDLLDEFEIKATQAKSEAESSTNRGQVKKKFLFFGQPCPLVSETKLQEIKGRFENIVNRMAPLSLREKVVDRSHHTNKRLPSTSLPEFQFFGRENEEAEILKLLTNKAKNANSVWSIVSIIGMGGVGKTALAQRLYNDAKVSSCFKKRAWVCVSDVFDVLNITKTILQSITKESCKDKDFNDLQMMLKDSLSRKKFLVVLDDVWYVKYEEWTSLLKPFRAGAKGSKIIITTRNDHVVSITGASRYLLTDLPIDSCTSLLAYHALEARSFETHPDLEIVGKKIAKKCKGLPLAAKILGGLLRDTKNPNEWEAILNNNIWDVASGENDEILPALKLSYVHLPSYLKRCFAYCAMFPKDYEFERDELVLLWRAEGFLDGRKAKENILRSGQKYFNELVSRSFFQQSNVDTSKFLMHDLLNDLAKSIAGVTCFTSGESQVVSDEDDASFEEKVRYASFVSQYVTSESLRAYAAMKVLRSLMLLNVQFNHKDQRIFISGKVLHDLLTNSKYLRVLSLCHCDIIEVPNCVCDSKHLRYLNLSYTNIKRLPESIGALCKLQALILRGCQKLSTLPPSITKLARLQFLDIRDTGSLEKMPPGISNLKNIIILPKFVVGPEKGSKLKELKSLPHLLGEVLISELQKVKDVRDAVDANLSGKQDLRNLFLRWNKDFGHFRDIECEARILQHLQPHTNLENLTLSYYGGKSLPQWLGHPSYFKIVSLCLHDCPNVESLPSLGQLPALKELSLERLNALSMIGSEFYGIKSPFPSLTSLTLIEMSAWKDWSCYAGGQEEEVPFSCLQHLVVLNCPELTGTLPHKLNHLIKLNIRVCSHLHESTNEVHLPSLRELCIWSCNKEILKSLVNLTSLTVLKIDNLMELVYFDYGFMSCLAKLKELHISSCYELTYLWQDGDETRNLTCLRSVVIQGCPRFTSFVAGEGEIELPCKLQKIELMNCTSLERLPKKMHTLRGLSIWDCPKIIGLTIPPNDPSSNDAMSQLKYLQIGHCDSWISFSFAKNRFPALKTLSISMCKGVESLEEITSLKSLVINNCKYLRSLPPCLHTFVHLTCLEIIDCPLEIEDFPPLPHTLSSLSLSGCWKMKSIANCNIASCNNLTYLRISGCSSLEIEDFPLLPIAMSSLTLHLCPKMKSLPNEWLHLTSLQKLQISMCENIERFPEGGLPPNLREFSIWRCENMKQPVREWGLPLLTSLTDLTIYGRSMGGEGEKVRFPLEDEDEDEEDAWSLLFPSSLTRLAISEMRNVEILSSGLRNHLSSLRELSIRDCPKLRDLPEDGFPPSLHILFMSGSSILKDRCSEFTGVYWPLIQEIPRIFIS